MKQNYFFKTFFLFLFITVIGHLKAQNASLFFTPSGLSIQRVKVTKSNNNIYITFGSQAGTGVRIIGPSGADGGAINNESAAFLTDDANGDLYYQVQNSGVIKKIEVQNNNAISTLYTVTPQPNEIAFGNNTLFYRDMMGIKYIVFSGGVASPVGTLYAMSQNTPDSPKSMYVQGGFLYLVLSNSNPTTSKVVKYDISNLPIPGGSNQPSLPSPVDVATGIPTDNVSNLFIDASGNVYYTRMDSTLNRRVLDRFTPGQGTRTIDNGSNGNFLGIDVDASGNVYYTAFNANTTPNQLMYKITGASTLSTKSLNTQIFTVSPNPAKDFVSISNVTKGAEVNLYDMTGKLLYSTRALSSSLTINTSSYQNGVYILKVDGQSSKLLISK